MVDGTENHERNLLVLENDHAAVSSKVEAVKEICRFDTLRSIKNDGDLLTRFLSAVIKFLETYPNECSKAVLDVLESAISDIVKLRDTFPLTSNLLNIICAVVRTGELELLSVNNATERKSEDKYSAGKDGLPDKLVRLMKCLNLCDKSVMWDKLGGAPNFATYIAVILKCMNMRGSSDSVLTDLRQQTLGTVFRIFSNVKHTGVKPVSNETLNEWVEILLSLVFDSNRDIQKSAVHALQLMWTCLAASGWTKDFVCSPELKKQIKSDYCPKLIKLVESPERVEPSWEVVWCLLVDLLANQLLSNQNSQLTNSMLAVEERAFKRSDRAPAFKCWKYLIEKLCASNGQDIKRHLKLLLQPLVISNTKNEQLIRLKHEVFWFFVCCAAPLCDECGVILNAFLRFNFGIPDQTDLSHFNLSVSNSSVTGNGKHAFSGLKRNFHIFRSGCIDRLAQVLSPTPPESRDDFDFESPKLSVAMIKSPAQFLRLHPLIIYCACSAVLIVAYRKNREAQEVLNIVWESLVYHIKSFVTSEDSQKTKITEVTRDFLCFLRSMSRQCTDDNFSSLLLSPVFENVICGRNCFPPAFLSSRLWHMKMTDDMLPTPAAVLVECLLTPAVVPQDDQSSKFLEMMEVLVECGFSSDCPLDLALGVMRRLEVCSYECDGTKALTVYFTWYSLVRKLETDSDKFREVDPDLRSKLVEMVLGFPIARADYFILVADKVANEKQKPFDVWRNLLSSAVTNCTEEDKLNNKMCVHLCSKLMVYLKKDLNQQQCLYISKYICVLGETLPWKDVTSHLVYSLDDIDCHTELLDEPCEQMSGIIDVLLSLYDHVIKYEDNSAEKCSELLRNLGICLTTVCEAILNEVVFLSFVIKLKHVIAFLMLNFCNRGDEVLEHLFICCWMKITHSVERHWGHINSESLTAAVITMLKAVAEHGSLEILRYTLKFWIGLPPKCNDLTPNLKQEMENMFVEMNSSLQKKEEKLKSNKNKTGSTKKRASLSEKLSVTTYSPVSVESAHLNELSEKISSVKIETLSVNGRTGQNLSSADGTLSSDDTTGSSYIQNPFARTFFSSRTRRSLVPAEVDTNVAVSSKSIEPLYGYDEINVLEKDNVKLNDCTSIEQEDKNIDNPSDVIVPEKHFKGLASEDSSECNLEGENACLDGESSIDHSEAEGDNTSDTESVGGSIQQNKSRLSLRKNHEIEDKQHQLSDKTLEADNQLESNKMDTKIDKGFFKETETEITIGKSLSVADGSSGNLDVRNSNTEEGSCTENSVNNTIPSTVEEEPISLFGQVCDRSVAKHQISPSAKSRTEKEVLAENKSQSEDANLKTLLDQNSHFAKPEERRAVRRRKSLPVTDLPVRQSPRRPLTKHQKECLKRKRDDIPALYCDLSEDSQGSSFSEMSQDDSQISIPERLSLTKTARPEERQLSFTHLRRVTKPNSLSSLIQKTLEAPEEVMKNEPSKARPFSDVISPKAKVRKIDTTDTEHKSPAGNDHKCPSSEAASVSTLKDSTEHVEKQLEGDAEGNNLSPTKSSEIKASAADNNSSVKDDKENSSSINTVGTCSVGSEPDISSIVASTVSENSPNRRKSLRPLKRIVRNAVKNSGNNKVGHINKWRTQNRRESLHPLKRLVSNKGKNSKLHMLQRGLLKDKKNLSPVCNIVDQNTIEVAKDLGSPNRAVWEMASISEKKQLTPTRGETVVAKHTTPSPLKDLTQSKIDKYTLRTRLSSDGNVLQAKKCVQHNRQQIKRQTSTGLSPSSEGTVEVSVEINQRDVQDAEDAMRKSRVAEVVKSDPNSKLEQCVETGNTSVNLKDGVSVQLQLASTDKETVGNLVLECVPTGQLDDTNTEKSKSKKLRGRPRKSLSMKPETTAKDVCDVLSETAKHNNVNVNDKSTSEGLPQNVGGVKTRKVKLRSDGDAAETRAECDDQVEKARGKEKEESVHKCQSDDKPSEVLHPLFKTVTVPNDVCRTEVVSKDVSDSIPQVDESTKVFSNDAVQRVSPTEEGCELQFTKDQEKGYVMRSVDEQQSNNLKLVSGPYVHLTNIVAKSNVPNNSNEHLKSTTGNEEQKPVQQSFLDAEDFVEDSQDLTLTASKKTRKWTRRISDGRNARSSLDSRSVQLIAPGSSKANTPELAQLTATREEGEKGTSAVSTLKTTSDTGYCEPVNEIVGSGLLSENTNKQKKSVDSYKCSDTPAEEYSPATILSVHEVDCVNNIGLCKDSVKPVVGKETQEVPNTVEVTAAANVARGLVNVQSVTALTTRRSLRARRKPKTHGCLYSSCCRQVETNKTRIAKRITAKSLRLVRQGQLQKAELPANGGSPLSDVESEVCAESDRQSARQKTAKTAAISGPVLGSTFSKDRPETNTKAESSCLKRKSISDEEVQKDDVSPKKQKKRVSFSDPDVSRTCYFDQYPIEELDKDYLWIANSGRMQGETLEDQLALDMEELMDYSESMEEDMSLLDSQSPIWPSLAGCTYPVEEVVKFVVAPTWAKNAVRYFEEQGIKTIGDISSLDEARISTLPVREPKVTIVKRVLKVYEEKLNRIKAGATAAEVNSSRVRRKVQRVQRKAGLAAVIRKSSTQAVVEMVPTSQESDTLSTSARDSSTSDDGNNAPKEGLQKKDSEVEEVAFESLSSALVDNKDTLNSHSEEVASADVQKVLPGSSHSSVVEVDTPKIEEKKRAAKLEDLQKKNSEVGEVAFESLSSAIVDNKDTLNSHSEEVASAEVQKVLSGSSHSSVVEKDTLKLDDKKLEVNLEGRQKKDSEVGEAVFESLSSPLIDNKGTLHNHSEEVPSTDAQKVLSGSSHSSVVEKGTKDGTYVPVASTSRNQSSPFRAYDESTKDLTPSNQTVEKKLKDDDTELKGRDSQKHVQEELVVVSRESTTVINSAKVGGGQTEEVLEKIVPTDSLVSAKETNDSSTQWQEEVLSQKEFDSILGDWNIAMSDDLLESGCMEILENGNCKEDGDVHSNNEFAVSTDLPQTSTAAVFASHSASGNGNKLVADRSTVSCVEKPKDSVDCSIPELKTAIEKHSLVTVTHELLRLWKYGERLSQDISVGTLLNRLENAEVKDLKQQRQSVAVQTNSCLCDPNTINALKMIYEKITCSEEKKT